MWVMSPPLHSRVGILVVSCHAPGMTLLRECLDTASRWWRGMGKAWCSTVLRAYQALGAS
jgi:hypothetical protein